MTQRVRESAPSLASDLKLARLGRGRPPATSSTKAEGYVNRHSSAPSFGTVRIYQRTFVPSPPPGTERLELRFRAPSRVEGKVQFVTSVDLR